MDKKSVVKSASEVISVSIFVFMFTLFGPICALILICLLFTPFWFVSISYVIYMIMDKKNERRDGVKSINIKNWTIWNHVKDYFPITISKSKNYQLDTGSNYMILSHPHGIMAFGVFVGVGTESLNFGSKMVPNIDCYTVCMNTILNLPIWRDIIMALGGRSADKETFDNIFGGSEDKKGKLVTVVVGGAREALDACPGKMDIILNNRKGVFRMALKHGVHVIPSISFGENDIYHQKYRSEDEKIKNFQIKFMKKFSFSIPYFYGRFFSWIPFRRPINVVIGEPIKVAKCADANDLEVEKLQNVYISKLIDLYEENRKKFGYENVEMNIK